LNGAAVLPAEITLTGVTVPTGFTLNANGTITIAPSTPAGTYTLTYQICEQLNPTNCDQTTVTLTISAAAIDAVADAFGPINGYTGATTASVLSNDLLNGAAVLPAEITLTGVTVPTGFTLNANGTITIAPSTPPVTYTLTYQICEQLNPTNCDQADVTVVVGACKEFPENDCDGDGVTNGQEVIDGTDPIDGCNLLVSSQNTTPTQAWLDADCDGDGVTNGQEVIDGTDLDNPCDTDFTSITLPQGGLWLIADCDGDGVNNGQEIEDGTDPNDGCDLIVSSQNTTPTQAWLDADCDGDGVTNGQEVIDGTDLNDGCELVVSSQNTSPTQAWLDADCDGDGVTNGQEVIDGTDLDNPCDLDFESITLPQGGAWLDADCDGDGVSNAQELIDGTDPNEGCDLLVSSQNTTPSQVWLDADCDGDGLTNGEEIESGSSFQDPCSPLLCLDITIPNTITPDGDGINDSFVISGLENYPNNSITIFNRWGSEVFFAAPYLNDWFGTSINQLNLGGDELPTGTFYYILELGDTQKQVKKGYIFIQR
jgi:gliding motility-associated-like protein